MKKSEWSDSEIEQLLRSMPKIIDRRDPRDIYQSLSLKKRKNLAWVLPSIAAAAVLFLFMILGPKLTDQGQISQFSLDQATEKKAPDKNAANEKRMVLNKEVAESKESTGTNNIQQINKGLQKSAVYEDEIGNGKVFTYWIPDEQAQILIPVSTIVPKAQNKPWLDVFNEQMVQLKESQWGLSEYYPLNAELTYDEKEQTLNVNVPADHQYGQGSTSETGFLNILKKDISSNSSVKSVKLFTNHEPGIEFGNTGLMKELDIEADRNHAYLFYFPKNQEQPYLVPTLETYKDIKDAMKAMKEDRPEYGLKKSMFLEVQEENLSIQNNTLFLSMEKNSKIEDDKLTLSSFEAILLTAKEFGLDQVIVKDAPVKQIGPFNLSMENKVPIAPNLRNLE